MGDDQEWMKLPTEDKVVHKAWKARVAGYEEAIKIFQMADGPKSPEFSKFLGAIKKMVTDSNAIAQEKALECVLLYIENAHVAGKTAGEVVGCVVNKCLNATRAKTKERGIDILLMYIEIEKQEIVQDELMKGLANKQPKIVVACVQTLKQALSEFGPKVITIKPLVKQIQSLLEHRDKLVREEGKQLVVEIYRWIGAALKPQLSSLKPVQVTELEAEFENVAGQKAQQTRFLRSQQDLKAKFEAQAEAAEDGEGEEGEDEDGGGPAMEVDPYDLMDPVDILSKLPKDFYEKTEAKKWQERKEGLEALQKLTESPKIDNGDFNDVVRVLKRVISKDTNVMLVTVAAKCVTGLATGLRKKFSQHVPGCIDAILEKFKEKKPTVVAALREAADACFRSISSLDPISESIVAMLAHKTPQVKAETASFLARCFTKCTLTTLPKKLLKMFAAPLLKCANDTAPDVREASFTALGTAMKVVGEKHLGPFLADVEALKMEKIKECCEKAEVIGKGAKPATAAAPKAAAPAKAAAKPASARPGAPPKKPQDSKKESGPAGKSAGAGRPKTAPAKGGAKKKAPAKGKKGPGGKDEEPMENILSDEAVEDQAAALLPGDTIGQLASSNWKERLAAMETFHSTIKRMSKDEIPCQVCVRTVTKKPGLKETNFQVMKLKVEMISHLAQNAKFSKRSAGFVLSDLVDKVGDVKNGGAVKEAFSYIAEATSLEYVSMEVVTAAFEQKNPKNQAESLNWLSQAVKEFGLKVNVKAMIDTIKKALAATNPAIRTAAITMLGVFYMYMGATLRVLFESEKSALLAQIDAEIEKVGGEKPPAPTRGLSKAEEGEAEEEEEEEEGEEGINAADLVPRTDISEKITDDLVTELGDKNWKIRNEALQKVVAILNEAKFITANIGPLPEALKHRLSDSNKILTTTTVNICLTLATAMGPHVKNHVRVLGPGMVGCFGDSKPQVRAAAVNALNAWVEQGGFKIWVEAEIFSDELKKENPNLRTELLGWLAAKLPDVKKPPIPELRLCIPHVLTCLEDRNAGVRTKAQEALVPFMIHLGYDYMAKQAGKLKPSSKDSVIAQLEKARGNLPAKPVKTKAPAAAPAAPRAAAAVEEEEEEPERPATAPAKTAAAKNKSKVLGKKAAAAPVSKKKKEEDVDTSPALRVAAEAKFTKEERFKDEKKLKVLKWNFTTPRQEFFDQLQTQMEPSFNKTLMENLFHADFKKHIIAIETLMKACEEDIEATIANVDLVLKWLTLRFFDTNTSVLLKALEYLTLLFTLLSENEYHLHELEANSFIPYLINKVGDPKENVRREIRAIFKKICSVYPASKMFSFVIEGIKSKNTKQKTECLEELGWLIETYGINVCQPSPAQALKAIAGQIGIRDNSVRSAALNTIVVAYQILGETVYKYVGNLNDKDQGMLDERIKRSAKSKPAAPPEKKVSPKEDKPRMVAKVPPNQKSSQEGGPRSGLQAPRTVKKTGRFQLDLDDDEEDLRVDPPNLIQIDVDEILNEPVKLPVIKSRRRPPSPSMKLLQTSSDAKSAVDLVISQVAGNDVFTSMQALHQIDEVLKDDEKSQAIAAHVDQLLMACSLQLRMASNKHGSASPEDKESIISLIKCILGTLLSLFQSKTLSRVPSKDALKDLIFNLVTVLLDSRLNSLEDGPQVVRSVNVMVVKIVEKGDHTNVMRALIKLLHESVENPSNSQKFLELVMKCLWKSVRMLPKVINDLDASLIIGDLHQFMKAFPQAEWRTRQNDTPLRTVKTILHSLAKLKGPKIIQHLDQIEVRNSEVELYLRKVLKNSLDQNSDIDLVNNENEQMNGQNDQRRDSSSKSSKRLSKSSHDMLAEIFKKIGSKENTREGLNDLYDFKLTYPDADLEPFLKKSSQFFQNYIERGLKNIEMEREGKLKSSGSAALSANAGGAEESGGASSNIAHHIQFLKESRAKCGFDNNDLNTKLNNIHDSKTQATGGAEPAGQSEADSVRKHVEYLREIRAQCGLDNRDLDTKFKHLLDQPGGEKSLSATQRLNGSSSSLSSTSSGGTQSIPSGMTTSTSNPENLSAATTDVSDLRRRLERIKNATKK